MAPLNLYFVLARVHTVRRTILGSFLFTHYGFLGSSSVSLFLTVLSGRVVSLAWTQVF